MAPEPWRLTVSDEPFNMISDLAAGRQACSPPSRPALVAANGQIVIGLSVQHSPIICLPWGRPDGPLRVLILAGQHGDERPARRTVESLFVRPGEDLAG